METGNTTTPTGYSNPTNKYLTRRGGLILLVVGLLLLLVALNFMNFRLAQSSTETEFSLATYRSGETLPASMSSGLRLAYTVTGGDSLSQAVTAALPEALAEIGVGDTTAVSDLDDITGPVLLVMLDVEQRLWTPVYGRAQVTATAFFADDGQAPWPLDEPVVMQDSPAVKADGEFTVSDTTWGLISKPAYEEIIAQALAQAIADGLQQDVFQIQ